MYGSRASSTDAKGKAKAGNASAEAARDNDITALLDDRAFIHNVGRVLVADMLLGNADRFEQVNGGNFFYLGVGKVGAIDNEAFCPSLEEVEKFVKTDRGEGVGRKATGEVERDVKNTWVNVLTGAVESSGVHKEAPMGSPQYLMTSFEEWAKKRFAGWATSPNVKPAAREKLLGIYGDPADAKSWASRSKGWGRVLADLSAGYEEGLKRLVANLNGPKGTSLLERAKELTNKHGADPVGLDYGALEVRATYIDVMAKTHDTGKAWDAARETAEKRGCTDKVARVLDFAQNELKLDPTRVTKLKIMFSALPADTQESLVSIRPGAKKRLDVFGSKNDAWEILRGKLLLRFELDVEMKSERAKKQVDVMTCGAVEAALKRAADIKAAFKSGSKVERAKIEKMWGVGPLT